MENNIFISKSVPVKHRADVLVVGGGLGGVAAALASARAGARTVLMERNGFVGGVATAGMCCSVFNCMATGSRRFRMFGIPYEITDALAVRAGGGSGWKDHKGHIIYDVERGKLVLLELLKEAGVKILLDSPIVDALIEDGRIEAVVSADASGAYAVKAEQYIDATGENVLAYLAGVAVDHIADGRQGVHSYCFRFGGVDTDAFVGYFRKNPDQYPNGVDIDWTLDEALAQYDETGTMLFPHGGGMQMSLFDEARKNGDLPEAFGMYYALNATQMHIIKETGSVHVITGFTKLKSLDSDCISDAVIEGRQMAAMMEKVYKKYIPGFAGAYISSNADDLGIRQTRNIDSGFPFTAEMQKSAYRCEHPIGIGVVMYENKLNNDSKAWKAQCFGEDVYEIPMECLIPRSAKNLIIGAGRGADTVPYHILRVMIMTMAVGQGAGVIASIAAKDGCEIKDADYPSVRAELERQGVAFS